jgi:hypothetical protein
MRVRNPRSGRISEPSAETGQSCGFFLSAHGLVRKNGRLGDPALPSLSSTFLKF